MKNNGFQAEIEPGQQEEGKKKPMILRFLRFTMAYFLTFFQSSRNRAMPLSVSG